MPSMLASSNRPRSGELTRTGLRDERVLKKSSVEPKEITSPFDQQVWHSQSGKLVGASDLHLSKRDQSKVRR